MKILHTADWHLGKRLERVSRLEEQQQVMDEICDIADARKADLVLIAGDLFDTFAPSSAAVDLFYKTLRRLSNNGARPVVAIAGNHDSAHFIEVPNPLARACGILLAGYPDTALPKLELPGHFKVTKTAPGFIELKLEHHSAPLRLLLTPYANEQRLGRFLGEADQAGAMRELLAERWKKLADTYCDERGINLLVTHLFFQPGSAGAAAAAGQEQLEEPEEEKPVLHVGGAPQMYPDMIPPQIQYTALGHLHRYIEVRKAPAPVIYSSSPLGYSFSEAQQQKYVVMIEAEPGAPVSYEKVPLTRGRPLVRLSADGVADAVAQLEAHQQALVELTLRSDTYLNATDRRRLREAHADIITLIPDIQQAAAPGDSPQESLADPKRPVKELFIEYFEHKKGQPPDEVHKQLLSEMMALQPPGTTSPETSPADDDAYSS